MAADVTQIVIPTLVRIKPGALDRMGRYLVRLGCRRVVILTSQGLPPSIVERLEAALASEAVEVQRRVEVSDGSFETAQGLFADVPGSVDALVGVGGGKALDVAKYVAFLARRRYVAVPTSLSNDGFCSPQSSLTLRGKRRSLPAALPAGVVIDTEVCLAAPHSLWCSGVGDLVAKVTAVEDWKIAFRRTGAPVNDFAALLSDATVHQFIGRPVKDEEGMRLLGTALMLNGIAMEICGSSRPASGSEHLISHALDAHSARPRLHGLQVGVATYLMAHLQGQSALRIANLFEGTGFWAHVAEDPFSRREWREAVSLAPSLKSDFPTILDDPGSADRVARMLDGDPVLQRCFVD